MDDYGKKAGARSAFLCDCHTWPTPEEAHRYIEWLESEIANLEGSRRSRLIIKKYRSGLTEAEQAQLRKLDEMARVRMYSTYGLVFRELAGLEAEVAKLADKRWPIVLDMLTLSREKDLPAPDIWIDEGGEIELDWWGQASLTIDWNGANWAILDGGHGTELEEFKTVLAQHQFRLKP